MSDSTTTEPLKVKRFNSMKVLHGTLETGARQAKWEKEPDSGHDRLYLDLNVRIEPEKMYRLERIAAHHGLSRAEFAMWLMEAAVDWFSDPRRGDVHYLDEMDERDFASLQRSIDWSKSKIESMRSSWRIDRQEDIPDPSALGAVE